MLTSSRSTMPLALSIALTVTVAVVATASGSLVPPQQIVDSPSVLVFENTRFQERLKAGLEGTKLTVVDCSVPKSCNPPPTDVADNVVAVVASLPRNYSLFKTLPNLKLYQSGWYIPPDDTKVAPTSVGISIYFPDYKNVSSKENGVDPLAEWTVAAVLKYVSRMDKVEAEFRRCAYADDAPLDCPVFSELTTHKTLWNSGSTVGIVGFGAVGKAMTKHFAALGVNVIASDIEGPYTPLPPGLSWFGKDNDHVVRNSDFFIPAVPSTVGAVINKTSLSMMKTGCVVIPPDPRLADYDAMYDALANNKIGGAILDTWSDGCWSVSVDCGPPFGAATQPFAGKGSYRDLPNVYMTPNMAMQTETFWDNSADFCAANLVALVEGKPLQGMVRNITAAL